ncbi:MAG TPA: sulfatase [Pirellulales bacterium]|nr:sulfatase [Pirellulales bacterium]
MMQPRRAALAGLLLLFASTLLAAPAKKLNVLFIAVDDLRPELACFGAKDIVSPNIDRLASRGLLFERAYCQVAVCNPSRNSVLAGARPDTTGVYDNQTSLRTNMPDVVTLPEHFKNHGYKSISLGKIFHQSEREPHEDPQSWSEPPWYHGTPNRSWFTKASEDYIASLKKLPEKKRPKLLRAPPFEAADEADEVYGDGQLAAKAIATLEQLKGETFFLGVGFHKPHLPFNCPQKYWGLYPADTIHVAENAYPPKDVPAPALHTWYELRSYGTVPPTGDIPLEMKLNLIRGYKACVSFIDAQIGKVLDALDRLGLADNTIVILWGDHGYHLGENDVWTKMTNFELGARAPMIISVPGQQTTGRRSRALVEYVDIYPTLAELCSLPRPSHLEGTSFVPLLADPDRTWKTAAFSQYVRVGKEKFHGRSIRTDRWRYTEWKNMAEEIVGIELYDHQTDPQENVNVAGDASQEQNVSQLKQQLYAGWKAAKPEGQ